MLEGMKVPALDFELGAKVKILQGDLGYIRGCIFYRDEQAWHYAVACMQQKDEEDQVWYRVSELERLD